MLGWKTAPAVPEDGRPKGFDDYDLRLGDLMRGERATLAKSLLDVQRELKIKASYVAAIENADVSAFETPSFIAGYVRSYARYLGMDPEEAFQRFCREANFTVAHGMSAAASGQRRRADKEYSEPLANPNASFVPRAQSVLAGVQPGAVGSLVVLIAVALGLGYGGWAILNEVQKVSLTPVDQAPGVVAELSAIPGTDGFSTDVVPAASEVALAAVGTPFRTVTLDAPVFTPRDSGIAAIDPATTGALPEAASREPAIDAAVAEALAGEPVARTVVAEAPEVALLAVRPAWVRVTAQDGTVVFEKILDAGERFVLPEMQEAPMLHAGNAGAVYFSVGGETFGPASGDGQTVREVELSALALRGRYQPADPNADPDLGKVVAEAN